MRRSLHPTYEHKTYEQICKHWRQNVCWNMVVIYFVIKNGAMKSICWYSEKWIDDQQVCRQDNRIYQIVFKILIVTVKIYCQSNVSYNKPYSTINHVNASIKTFLSKIIYVTIIFVIFKLHGLTTSSLVYFTIFCDFRSEVATQQC